MTTAYPKSQNIPIPTRVGLVSALRDLKLGESIAVPEAKKSSIHPAARRAGVRVTLRTLGDGTVRAWRIPDDASSVFTSRSASRSASDSPRLSGLAAPGEDIFGRPLKKTIFD